MAQAHVLAMRADRLLMRSDRWLGRAHVSIVWVGVVAACGGRMRQNNGLGPCFGNACRSLANVSDGWFTRSHASIV